MEEALRIIIPMAIFVWCGILIYTTIKNRNKLAEKYRQRRELKNMAMAGKYALELNYPGDGRLYLNYWDWQRGQDVCCQVFADPVNGFKIVHNSYDNSGNLIEVDTEITFMQFIEMVEASICETDRIIKPNRD